MHTTRTLAIPSALALLLTFVACGGEPGDDGAAPDDDGQSSEVTPNDTTPDPADEPDTSEIGVGDDDGEIAPDPNQPAGTSPFAGLADVVQPADQAAVTAVLEALPTELISGTKQISARTPSDLAADYVAPDRMSQYGIQATDLRTSMMGSFVSEPVAEQFVAVFAEGADWEVEDTGLEGSLHWVEWFTTGSGEGIEGIEEIYSLTWGEAGSPWAFVAGAPTEAGRDELISAFVAAAAEVAAAPDPEPATPDELAAQGALSTDEDFGQDWVAWPDISQDTVAFHGLTTSLMADEPLCTPALEWLDREDVELSGFLDVFAAGSTASAEGPAYVSRRDGMSDLRQTVYVFASADQLDDSFGSARQSGWVECATVIYDDLAQALYEGAFPGVTVSVDTAYERSLDLGDASFAQRYEITLRAPDGGGDLRMVQDISIVTVGRAASAIVQQSYAGGIDEELMDDLIELAAERLFEQFGDPNEGGS